MFKSLCQILAVSFVLCGGYACASDDGFDWDRWAKYNSDEELPDAETPSCKFEIVTYSSAEWKELAPDYLRDYDQVILSASKFEIEGSDSRKRGRPEAEFLDDMPPADFDMCRQTSLVDVGWEETGYLSNDIPFKYPAPLQPAWGKKIESKPIDQLISGNFGFEFRHLNCDSQLQILLRCDQQTIAQLRLVSKYLYALVDKRAHFKPKAKIPSKILTRAINNIQPIRSLILDGLNSLIPDLLRKAIKGKIETLSTLVIANCNYCAYDSLNGIQCKGLKRLILPVTPSSTLSTVPLENPDDQDLVIGLFLDLNPDLFVLNVSGWTHLTSVAFANEDAEPLVKLTHIVLNGCQAVDDECIRVIQERCPKLLMLALGWCSKVTDRALPDLQIMCDRGLKFLSIHDSGIRSEESLGVLMSYLELNLATEWPVQWLQ